MASKRSTRSSSARLRTVCPQTLRCGGRARCIRAFCSHTDPGWSGQPRRSDGLSANDPVDEAPGGPASKAPQPGSDFSSLSAAGSQVYTAFTAGPSDPAAAAQPQYPSPAAVHPVLKNSTFLRVLTSHDMAADVMANFLELADAEGTVAVLAEDDCMLLMTAAIDRGNVGLAQSIYYTMGKGTRGGGFGSVDGGGGAGVNWAWPSATLRSMELLVLLLIRELKVDSALEVIARIRNRGMPAVDEIPFGVVVSSPLARDKPLTVIQPQEGCKVVACATSRYEFEMFSGTVVGAPKSEATNASVPIWAQLGLGRQGVCQATHELVVRTPDGDSRTFRIGTSTASVPAQDGERVTVVLSPSSEAMLRKGGLFTSRPPSTRAGEPLVLVNHDLGIETRLVRPSSKAAAALPSWALPVAGALLLGGAGSGLVDPNYPSLLAGGAVFAGTSWLGGSSLVIPSLKRLPSNTMAVEEVQQQLLEQHSTLINKARALNGIIKDDVRALARLWQLQVKMQSVGSSYDTRLTKVIQARSQLERQLSKRLVLLEGYSRIGSMIEIEVEMNTEVPQAEIDDIESQIRDLTEVEEMQREWELEAEARDELERLLRVSP